MIIIRGSACGISISGYSTHWVYGGSKKEPTHNNKSQVPVPSYRAKSIEFSQARKISVTAIRSRGDFSVGDHTFTALDLSPPLPSELEDHSLRQSVPEKENRQRDCCCARVREEVGTAPYDAVRVCTLYGPGTSGTDVV